MDKYLLIPAERGLWEADMQIETHRAGYFSTRPWRLWLVQFCK